MINLSIHGVTSVELSEPTAFESQGVAHWSADILVHQGNECQVLRLFTKDGPDALSANDDALRASDDALDARHWSQVAQRETNIAKRWQNVALDQTRRADALQQELDDLRADLAGLSRRMAE